MIEHTTITEYNQTAAALTELQQRYDRPFDVSTSVGLKEAKAARATIKVYRVDLEKVRKDIKAPALERCRLIDEEAKRITAALLALEKPIDQAIKAEEQRKEEEKAAKARAEAERVAAIARRLDAIRRLATTGAGKTALDARTVLEQAQTRGLDPADYDEYLPNALQALAETVEALTALVLQRTEYEQEQARLQAERVELARQRAEEAAQLRAEREKQAAELRAQREAQAQRETQARNAREAEAARLRAEQEAFARRQAEEAAQLQAEREQQEAVLRTQREEQTRIEREAEAQRQAEQARLQAEREEIERQRTELARKAEAAKSAKAAQQHPLNAIKKALAEGKIGTEQALHQAYDVGYQAGRHAQHAA